MVTLYGDPVPLKGARCKRGRVQLSSLRGLDSLVFEGVLYLSARSNQGNTVVYISHAEMFFTVFISLSISDYLCSTEQSA